MTQDRQLLLEQRAVRDEMNALANIERTAETDARLGELRAKMDGLSAQMDAYLDAAKARQAEEDAVAQAAATPMAAEAPEVREFDDIYRRARLFRYIENIQNNRPQDGAEAEFSAAVFGAEARNTEASVPIHMFLDLDETLEVRAATVLNNTVGHITTRPILQEVFARTDALYLGARFQPVAYGTQRYPYITGGAELGYFAEGADVSGNAERAAAISVKEIDPVEGAMTYEFGKTTLLRFPMGELEGILRQHARMSIANGMDNALIKGNGTPKIEGLETFLTATQAPSGLATITAETMAQLYASRVDGKWAYTMDEPRFLVRQEVYQAVATDLFGSSGTFFADRFGPDRFRASARLAAPGNSNSVTNVSRGISYVPTQDMGNWIVPVWQDVGVIYDEVTLASRREVKLVFSLVHNSDFLNGDPWGRHPIKSS